MPPPSSLYVDSDMPLNYLIRTQPHHARAQSFLRALAVHGTTLYISSLTWLELAHVVTREDFRRRLPLDLQQRFHLDRWQDQPVREAYVRALLGWIERLLDQFAWNEVFITDQIRVAAIQAMTRFRLSSQDACHLACAQQEGVQDFASFDEAYRRVDGLILWNDLIHTSP